MRIAPSLGRRVFIALLLSTLLGRAAAAQTDEAELLRAATQRSPAVATLLEGPLKTSADRLGAVFTLLDLGETDVAAALFAPVIKANLDDAGRAELVERFGTARFLNLARRDGPIEEDEPAPFAGARKFADRCIEAAARRARDPKRVSQLVDQLNDPSIEIRNAARVDIAVTGTAGAKACLESLAQEADPSRRANLMLAITKLRPAADPLLLAVLAAGEGHLLRDAAELAGHTGMLDAAPFLAAIAVRPESEAETVSAAQTALVKLGLSPADLPAARGLLRGEIQRLESAVPPEQSDSPDETVWWIWSQHTGPKAERNEPEKFFPSDLSVAGIRTVTLERLARTLVSCGQANLRDRQLAAIYFLASPEGIFGAVVYDFDQFSVDDLSDMLTIAVRLDQMVAAVAFADNLGERGEAAALRSFDSRPSPLVRALTHSDRRLRFAALGAAMKINPSRTFPGASAVPKALWRFAAGAGTPQAVAASSVSSRASDWAGQMRALGYDATMAVTGREALEVSMKSPRLTLVLVDSDIGRPRLREVIYQLRAAKSTGRVPVAVLSSLPNLDRAQQLADGDPLLLAVARPHSKEAWETIVQQLNELGSAICSPDERMQQAANALQWIADLQATGHPYDEFFREADVASRTLFVPELLEPSLKVLAVLGTAESQRSLVNLASTAAMPIETRHQAVEAFANSVQRHGKLLTPTEISVQFDRYNASETAPRETQRVLGQLLDILEGKPPTTP